MSRNVREFSESEYRSALEELRFSETEKRRMALALVEAGQEQERRARRPLRRTAAAVLACVLVAALAIGAGAAGLMKSPTEAFSWLFEPWVTGKEPAQENSALEEIVHPVLASASDNGLTITVDSVLMDRQFCFINLSLSRDDGRRWDVVPSPEDCFYFESESQQIMDRDGVDRVGRWIDPADTDRSPFVVMVGMRHETDGAHADTGFYDDDPDDSSIQYTLAYTLNRHEAGDEFPRGKAKIALKNLVRSVLPEDADPWEEGEIFPVWEGSWELEFSTDYESPFLELELDGAGNGSHLLNRDLKSVIITPLYFSVNYSVTAEQGYLKNLLLFDQAPCRVKKADGTVIEANRERIRDFTPGFNAPYSFSLPFDEAISVNDIVSVSIGDLEIPVH